MRSRTCRKHGLIDARNDRDTRQAEDDRQRQRHRVHQQRDPALSRPVPGRVALHRAGKADPERLHRVVQWSPARRTPDETLFTTLAQVRVQLGRWRADYNDTRPHSRLGWQTPAEFARTFPRRETALRNPTSSAPSPAPLTPPPRAIPTAGANSGLDKTWGQRQWGCLGPDQWMVAIS